MGEKLRSNTATKQATHEREEERSQSGFERSSKVAQSWRILRSKKQPAVRKKTVRRKKARRGKK
jgi:hypothetical protein